MKNPWPTDLPARLILLCDCFDRESDGKYGPGKRQHKPLYDIDESKVVWACEICARVRDDDPRVTPADTQTDGWVGVIRKGQ